MLIPRLPEVWATLVLAALWMVGTPVSASTAVVPESAEVAKQSDLRAQLLKEQGSLQGRFDEELAACRQRFAVTGCVEAVERQRRAALAPVRERLIQLDEAERLQRANARRQAVADKQLFRAQRPANLPAAQADSAQLAEPSSAASAPPRQRQRLLPAAAPAGPLSSPMPAPAPLPMSSPVLPPLIASPPMPNKAPAAAAPGRAAEAAQRVREAQRRQAESEQRRERVEKRLAEREKKSKPSDSLPPPARAASGAQP